MSLFQTNEFWSNQCAIDEEFDQNSLAVSQLNANADHIIIGSHSGLLRIYKPSSFSPTDTNNYKPNDLLVEKDLDAPILQVGVGKLTSGSQQIQVAALHPRSLAVYSFTTKGGIAEHGMQYILTLLYEHKLRRTSANFTLGPFGGAQNRDFLCVQSLDGLLTFFEQETFNFCCFLPEFLLPGPLVYVKSTDSFVTCGWSWKLQSISYKDLSEIGHTMNQDDTAGKKVINKIWSYNLGEGVIDIQTMYEDCSRQNFIAVLGEKNLYLFYDNGKLKIMKKLEFMPVCFSFYYLNNGTPTFLVISDNNTMLVYQNSTVKWSARLQFLPVALSRVTFLHVVGVLVFISESGYVQMCYLGTRPNIFSAPPLRNQELNFEAAENELDTLSKIIKCNSTVDINLANANAERELMITATVNPKLQDRTDEIVESQAQNSCQIIVSVIPQAIFEEVHVSIHVQKPLVVSPRAFYFKNLAESIEITSYVYLTQSSSVPNLNVDVSTSFITSLGVPRVSQKSLLLPISLVMETCQPVKENEHKVTLNINENPVSLSELFPEFMGENSLSVNSNAIGFEIKGADGPVVTILTAKSSQRYRIQSDAFTLLNVIVQEVIRRLNRYYNNKDSFKIIYTSSLPISETIKYIRLHFETSQKVNMLQTELSLLSAQFRLIQKRLITKFKQKNPTPLTNLDILLKDSFHDISNLMEALEKEKEAIEDSQTQLSCALQLLSTLLKLTDTDKDVEMIEAALFTSVDDMDNQNWEDVADASLCYLLRTSLAKSEKDKLRAPHTTIEEIKDVSKLEKHFIQVLERTSKRVEKQVLSGVQEAKDAVKEEERPVEEIGEFGTEIAKSSSRILSARRSLLRRRHKAEE